MTRLRVMISLLRPRTGFVILVLDADLESERPSSFSRLGQRLEVFFEYSWRPYDQEQKETARMDRMQNDRTSGNTTIPIF